MDIQILSTPSCGYSKLPCALSRPARPLGEPDKDVYIHFMNVYVVANDCFYFV